MSATSTVVTKEHFAYLAERTAREDDFLRELKEATVAVGMPAIWISPEQGSLMQVLLKANGAQEVVEVGTLGGYSAVWMARALPEGGRVRTIEIDPQRAEFVRERIGKSDVAGKVEVLCGDAKEILPTLEADGADAMFLDADKGGYPFYVEQGLRIVRKGGLILADNAFAFGQLFDENPSDREVPAVREFNDWMAKRTDLHGIILPIGDGLWVSVKE